MLNADRLGAIDLLRIRWGNCPSELSLRNSMGGNSGRPATKPTGYSRFLSEGGIRPGSRVRKTRNPYRSDLRPASYGTLPFFGRYFPPSRSHCNGKELSIDRRDRDSIYISRIYSAIEKSSDIIVRIDK